jgi:1-pyrroline-5-carboxylate dehydrogenase
LKVPLTTVDELKPYITSLTSCPKTGLHNPIRNVDRYIMLGRVSAKAAQALRDPVINDFFTRIIMRTSPKSYKQAKGEVDISATFLENFSGDNVRFLARSFGVPGDHVGQQSNGYRFPYGPCVLITPFNFPLEIPALQIMGALYMGNKLTLKVDSKVSVVAEQYLRLLHSLGLPKTDVDMINTDGKTMNKFLLKANPRNTVFTGSSVVAEKLSKELHGRIKIEDAGFDWKVLGPDVPTKESEVDYVLYQADQDAYSCSGQKCSAQSIMYVHRNWVKKTGIYEKMAALAAKRSLADLSIGPVLTWSTEAIKAHIANLLAIPGARLLFGGNELKNHTIPKQYGAIEPTAVFVPLRALNSKKYYKLVTKEVFGPLQVVTEFGNKQVDKVLSSLERMDAHLTAGVVSNNPLFLQKILGNTVNGVTYAGLRARTTGAPQNHWFGPSGDPRGAGIGTREAITHVWSSHREIINDVGPIADTWQTPPPN